MKMEFCSSRRIFMKSAAVFSGLAVLMRLSGRASAEAKQPLKEPQQEGGGYRLTEHIKKYYETAGL